jgi:hypothetical protein
MFIGEQFNSKASAPLGAEYQSKSHCAPKGAPRLVVHCFYKYFVPNGTFHRLEFAGLKLKLREDVR